MSSLFAGLEKVRARGFGLAAGACVAMSVGMGAASAQDCGCTVPLSSLPSGQAIGQLSSVSGPVNVLSGNGWVSASSGTPLFVGSQIETGAGAVASLAVGGCSLNLGAQSAASLIPANQALCVSVSRTAPGAAPGTNPSAAATATGAGGASTTALAIAGGGALAVVGIVAASTGDDDPVSQ